MRLSKTTVSKREKSKAVSSRGRLLLAMAVAQVPGLLRVSSAYADSLTWNSSTKAPVTDGSGTWDNTTAHWFNGTTETTWSNTTNANTIAYFGEASSGSAGTVNIVPSGIDAGGITLDKAYTFGTAVVGSVSNGTDGVITLAGSGGTDGVITVDSTGSGAIFNAALAGDVTIDGTGNVSLRGNNTGITDLTLNVAGIVYAGGADDYARAYLGSSSAPVTVSSNTTLSLQNGSSSYGGGMISLNSGTLLLGNYAGLPNALSISQTSYLNPQNNKLSGAITGNSLSTLQWLPASNNYSLFTGSLTGFTGTFDLDGTTNAAIDLGTATGGNANFLLGTNAYNGELFNDLGYSGSPNANLVPLGSLNGGPNTLVGGYAANSGVHTTYAIGSAGNSVFSGTIRNLHGDPVNKFGVGDFTAIQKVNSSTSLTLSGFNSYSDPTTVEAGTLILGNNTQSTTVSEASVSTVNTSTGTITLSSGTIPVGAIVTFGSNNGAVGTPASDYPDTGVMNPTTPYYVVSSSGTSFTVSATPGGSVFVPNSTGTSVVVSVSGALGATNTAVQLGDSGTQSTDTIYLELGGAYFMARPISVNADGQMSTTIGNITDNNGTFSGAITLNNNLTLSQAATTGSDILTVSGAINAGSTGLKTITFSGPGAMQATGIISNGTGTVSVITTAGTTTLTNVNSYGGATSVNGGTLLVTGSTAAGSAVTVQSGTLGGTGTINGTTGVKMSATVSPGVNGPGNLTLHATTLENGVNLAFDLNTPNTTPSSAVADGNDLISVSGNLTINPNITLSVTPGQSINYGTYVLATFSGLTNNSNGFQGWTVTGTGLGETDSFSINGSQLDVTFTPEPGSLSLILFGGAGLLARRRRTGIKRS